MTFIITMGFGGPDLITSFLTLEQFIENEALNLLVRKVKYTGSSARSAEKEKSQEYVIETYFLSKNNEVINENKLRNKLNKTFKEKNIDFKITNLTATAVSENEFHVKVKLK